MVRRFLVAFDAGDRRDLDEVFAREPQFRWYSTTAPGARLRAAASSRSSLVRYLARRHAVGEVLVLRSLRFNGNSDDGVWVYGNFVFTLTRKFPKAGAAPSHGKGAALCYDNRADALIVWSMARR